MGFSIKNFTLKHSLKKKTVLISIFQILLPSPCFVSINYFVFAPEVIARVNCQMSRGGGFCKALCSMRNRKQSAFSI